MRVSPVVIRRFFPPSWGSGCPEPQPFSIPRWALLVSGRVPYDGDVEEEKAMRSRGRVELGCYVCPFSRNSG